MTPGGMSEARMINLDFQIRHFLVDATLSLAYNP